MCAKGLFAHDATVFTCAKRPFARNVKTSTGAKRRYAPDVRRIQYTISVLAFCPTKMWLWTHKLLIFPYKCSCCGVVLPTEALDHKSFQKRQIQN